MVTYFMNLILFQIKMHPGYLRTCLMSLYFLITSAASPRDKYREVPDIVNSMNVDMSKEPTCDELRAMWRFSKRQSRAAEGNNEVPIFKDPFAFNVWEDPASMRSVGGSKMRRPFVYGRLVHNVVARPRIADSPERIRAFEEVARLFGTTGHIPKDLNGRRPTSIRLVGGRDRLNWPGPGGSFQHLKALIQVERARELREQKMAEENAVREGALHYQRMMFNEREREREKERERERMKERDAEQDENNYKSKNRVLPLTGDGPINFPEVLAAKFDNDLYANHNYLQRAYPDSMVSKTRTDFSLTNHDTEISSTSYCISFHINILILQKLNEVFFISTRTNLIKI